MSNGFGMILPQPVTAFIGGQQARQGLEAERMRQQAMQEEMTRSNKLRELGGAAFAAPAGPERQAALGQVAQVDPQQAINLQQQFAQLDETQKAQLRSQAREKLEPIAREIAYVSSLPEGQRQQAYDNALQRLSAQGADVSQFQGMPAEQGLMRARSQISEVSELLGIGRTDQRRIQSTFVDEQGRVVAVMNDPSAPGGVRTQVLGEADPKSRLIQQPGQFPTLIPTRGTQVGGAIPVTGQPAGIARDFGVPPEQVVADIEADMGRRLTADERQQLLSGGGQFNIPPEPAVVRQPTAEEVALGAARGRGMGRLETEPRITQAQELAKQGTEYLGEVRQSARRALTENNRLDVLEKSLSQAYTGLGAESVVLPIKRALDAFGVDTKNLGPSELARSLTNQLALSLRNPIGGEGMPGALSNSDRDFLFQATPGLAQSPDGWRSIIAIRRQLNDYAVQQARAANEFMRAGGSAAELPDYLQEWAEANPLFAGARQAAPQQRTIQGELSGAFVGAEQSMGPQPMRARNPQTGEVLVLIDGQWVPERGQ